jgi:hypothetical protein
MVIVFFVLKFFIFFLAYKYFRAFLLLVCVSFFLVKESLLQRCVETDFSK